MEFMVLSRDEIREFRTNKRHIVISVMDPEDPIGPAEIPGSRKRMNILRLAFHDWNSRDRKMIEMSKSFNTKSFVFFSEEMARRIVVFVRKALAAGGLQLIVCQCEAGISRSAGIAAALAKCINGDDKYFFKHFGPNTLVYSLIIKEWNKKISRL